MAIATLAMTASPTSAQFEIVNERNNDEHCPAITVVEHHVEGGCHFELTSVNFPLHAYIPQKVTVTNCEIYAEGVIDELGEGYITEAHLDPAHTGVVPCTRAACDEVEGVGDHPMLPWPFHLLEHGPGDEAMEAEFCLRTTSGGEGAAGNWCEIHLTFNQTGPHQYELGHLDPDGTGTEAFCENNPGAGYTGPHALTPAPTSIEPHFVTVGTEEIGIIH